jgi:type IV pilus assembly protein PilE
MRKTITGFTLIELLTTVAIVAIIATIAVPSYLNQMENTRRKDGQSALMGLAQAMERHYTEKSTYASAADGDPTSDVNGVAPVSSVYASEAPLDGVRKYYDLRITAATSAAFTLRAIPKNGQAGDGIMELSSTGVRRWDKNGDGDTSDGGEDSWN